jgi:dTDP-glucose 4,6-dehydratase
MRILVTGGAGFIGSHYVRTMLAGGFEGYEDAQVTVLDQLTYAGHRENLPGDQPRLRFVRGDVCDELMTGEVVRGHDAVVHFAAESDVDRSLTGAAADFVRTNVLGTQTLLEACRRERVEPFVYVSTDEVYGSIDQGSWTEDEPFRPNSPYAASKASGELISRAYWRTYGMDVRVTRCANNYGTHQHPEKLIPLFVTNLLSGRRVPLYGDGKNVREWLHVDDHCRAIQLVLTHGSPGRSYNIGSGVELSNIDMTSRLLELCGADWNAVEFVADRMGHDHRYSVDDTRIRTELGYAPRHTLDEGLAEVVRWYHDSPGWWRPLLKGGGDTR